MHCLQRGGIERETQREREREIEEREREREEGNKHIANHFTWHSS